LEDGRYRSPIFSVNVFVSNKDKGLDQHPVSIVDRLNPTELSSHLDGTGFIVKKKCDCSAHTATLDWRKKGSNNLCISNVALQKNRMEVIGVGITKDLSHRNWFLGK